jgi:hypothetical protein
MVAENAVTARAESMNKRMVVSCVWSPDQFQSQRTTWLTRSLLSFVLFFRQLLDFNFQLAHDFAIVTLSRRATLYSSQIVLKLWSRLTEFVRRLPARGAYRVMRALASGNDWHSVRLLLA